MIKEGQVWQHTKSGSNYMIVGDCRLEATGEEGVLYTLNTVEDSTVWARDRTEFLDGRFVLIENYHST